MEQGDRVPAQILGFVRDMPAQLPGAIRHIARELAHRIAPFGRRLDGVGFDVQVEGRREPAEQTLRLAKGVERDVAFPLEQGHFPDEAKPVGTDLASGALHA